MDYDAVIIGAGLSGLAAGIRLAHFERRVCILERHHTCGGLNSYYTRGGRTFDVGLHAVTNYVGPEVRAAPLPKLLRQLRLTREDFDLREQRRSEVHFPERRLTFTNDIGTLTQSVADAFPREADNFRRLVEAVEAHDDARLDHPVSSARRALGELLREPALIDMLLCPVMYYGNAQAHDMDWTTFVILFKSVFCEGLARPRDGIRTIISALIRRFRDCGGTLRTRCGVERIAVSGDRANGVTLGTGESLTAGVVLSSAGYDETMRLCGDADDRPTVAEEDRLSFLESILIVDELPARLGHDAAIVFYNDADTFTYAVPDDLIDLRSGIICCPSNYEGHDDMTEGVVRLTCLASYERWAALDEAGYAAAKTSCRDRLIDRAERLMPGLRDRIIDADTFTPRTIRRFTGHLGGGVYGTPHKVRDGRTRVENLFICGTDQGLPGIIGAMISGITMANMHVLSMA